VLGANCRRADNPVAFLTNRAGWPFVGNRTLQLTVAAIGLPVLLAMLVWLVGVRDTPAMFDPGAAQRALSLIKERSSPAMRVRELEITPRELIAWTRDREKRAWRFARTGGRGAKTTFEYSPEQVWHFSRRALVASGWQWDHLPSPDPVFDEDRTKDPLDLEPHDIPDLARLAQAAIRLAAFPAEAAVTKMSFSESFVEKWREQYWRSSAIRRHWTVRVQAGREAVDIDFDPAGEPIAVSPRRTVED